MTAKCPFLLRVLGRLPREGRCDRHERQASEKPQGRKPRDRFARWWRAMGIVRLPVVARWAGPSELGRDAVVADGDEVARRSTLREHPYRTDAQERGPRRR